MLTHKLIGVTDEVTRKLIIKNWLEYHFEKTGETMKVHRAVDFCNDKFCEKKKHQCVMHINFKNYDFCVGV